MASERIERRLAAVLAADMVGFSPLMEADEAGTLTRLKALRQELIDPKIDEYRGRIVKTTGDGMLADFVSAAAAVQSAVEIQRAMAERNRSVAENLRILFRVGINVGEIIIEGDDIYGNGVNVAARLEGLAEPGGVCISGSVYDQIEGILGLGFEDLGEQQVKNMAKPVHGYAVRVNDGDPAEPAATARGIQAHGDKPSIVVLPFVNMSTDAEQEFFADGMTEDIISVLSKISGLFVIARNSAFTYKGKSPTIEQLSRDLDVRYVLEGSIRKAGNRIRVSVQLVDRETGGPAWNARFDRDLDDIFALQDEITSNVVTALHVRLLEGEQARIWSKTTENIAAWECLMQGLARFRNYRREDNAKARELFQTATKIDPNYAAAWVQLGWTQWADARYVWTDSPEGSVEKAAEYADKALALDADLSSAHALRGAIHLMERDFDGAIAECEQAVALDPNGADVTALLAMALNWSGLPEKALGLIGNAKKLSPVYSAWYLAVEAHALRLLDRNDEAIAVYDASIGRNPDHIGSRIGRTSALANAGREDEARVEAAEILRISPGFTISKYARSLTYKNPDHAERSLDALRLAGLPE